MFFGDGRVHLVVPQAVGSTVVSLEPVTGLPQRLFAALASPEVFTGGCYYQGRLFMITALRTAGARVLSARPADTAWTDENYGAGLSTPVTATVTIATAPGTTNVIPGIVGQTLHITSITTGPWALGEAGDYKDTTGTAVPGAVAITGTTLIQTFSGTGAALTADAGLDIVTTVHSTVGAHTTAVGYYLPTTPAPPESLTSIAHYAAVPAPTYNPRYLYMTSFVISGNATISQRDYFGVYRIVLTAPDPLRDRPLRHLHARGRRGGDGVQGVQDERRRDVDAGLRPVHEWRALHHERGSHRHRPLRDGERERQPDGERGGAVPTPRRLVDEGVDERKPRRAGGDHLNAVHDCLRGLGVYHHARGSGRHDLHAVAGRARGVDPLLDEATARRRLSGRLRAGELPVENALDRHAARARLPDLDPPADESAGRERWRRVVFPGR
jgi:hypothetical protein